MSDADEWTPIQQQAPQEDEWQPVTPSDKPFDPNAGEYPQAAIPEAFMDRVRAGQALSRITQAAIKEGGDALGTGTPTGFSDETLNHLIDLGVFHDPAGGRPGPLQMANEAILMPTAKLWEGIQRATAAGIGGAGGAFGQLVSEFGGSQGTAERAKNEVINAGNWAMIEAGMGRFSRPSVDGGTVVDHQVGALPTPQDFTNAAKVLAPEKAVKIESVSAGQATQMWGGELPKSNGGDQQHFIIRNADNEPMALASISIKDGKANIDNIEGLDEIQSGSTRLLTTIHDGEPQNQVGPSIIRGALREFQKQHPEVSEITGLRVSGARFGGETVSPEDGSNVEVNLRRMWSEDGIHPAEAVHDAERDAFIKHDITAPHEEIKPSPEAEQELELTGGKPGSLSAAATDPADVPLEQQPASPAGSLIARAQDAADKLFDVGRDIQMKLTPMARGSVESMATVKDYMNSMRRNAWDSSRIDSDLMDRFSADQRERMARAMEEESLSLRLGEPASGREHQGLATLEPEERAAVQQLDNAQQLAWLRARDAGVVEGDGIPMHFPRMAIGTKGDTEIGKPPSLTQMYGIRKNSPYTKQRQYMEAEETEAALKAKYGDQAKIAWDIRAVNLATKMLEDAVAGRTLIKNIQEVGKRTGEDTVAEGFKPAEGWFTVDHPAFQKWRPKMGEDAEGNIAPVKDANDNIVFEQVPIYVRGDFEGPIRSALWGKTGEAYKGMMSLKGKTMGLIMNSPMIHNLVEFGRAFPAMPTRIFKAYFDGYRAKNDVGVMHEAINAGLVPIGKRFFNQDINAIMEAPDLTPGRSWTAKVLAAVPGMFDEAAGTAVKQAIDRAGDFWHNTLLWDRVADLQMGLYVNFRGDLIGKGMDAPTASRIAAHFANRYAGALPKEAMSEMATKVSNFMFFSRSFTFGNLGVMKDMLTGLPKDVMAQIERDAGFRAGSIEGADVEGAVQEAASSARSIARRKAIATVALDVALMWAGNTVLQSAFNVMLGGRTLNEEEHDYIRRARDVINDTAVHPLSLLNPFNIASIPGRLSSTYDNEPGKQNRIQIGYAKDGTAIYARNPVGKIGDEFAGYFDSPLDMMRKKEGTILRPLMQIYSNDAGFGRKVYDPHAETLGERAAAIGAMVKHLMASQLPVGQISAFSDLVKGEGDKYVNELQAFGPFLGVTFSKGAPGGPAVGEMYDVKSRREFAISQAMPDLRRQIQRGDIPGAQKAMGELGMDASYQRWVIRTSLDPRLRLSARSVRDFYSSANPEQRARFERAQGAPAQP